MQEKEEKCEIFMKKSGKFAYVKKKQYLCRRKGL